MNDLIVILIDEIENVALRGAIFRLYNNIRAFIVSLFLTVAEYMGIYFAQNGFPSELKDLVSVEMWEWLIVAVVLQMLGVASLEKYSRELKG